MDSLIKAFIVIVVCLAVSATVINTVRDNNATKVKLAELQQTELIAGKCVKVK